MIIMPSFTSLPTEVLYQICEVLANEYLPGISALSLVNKHLHAVASKHRFHHLKLQISGPAKLAQDVARWSEILERTSAFSSVRRLTFWGEMLTFEDEVDQIENDDTEVYGDEYYDDIEQAEEEDELTCVHEYYRSYHDDIVSVRNEAQYWGSLPDLVQKLIRLDDLVWACRTLFPSCLLEALGNGCRLHCVLFKLPSLHYADLLEERRAIDPYEYSLATSPKLTRIVMTVSQCYGLGGVEFNGEALFKLLRLTPNLQDVHIVRRYPHFGSVTPAMRQVMRNPPAWPGFFNEGRRKQHPGLLPELRCLGLSPANDINYFHRLQRRLAFSKLQILQLWEVSENIILEAARCSFPSLSSLSLDPNFDDRRGNQLRGDQATSAFIRSVSGSLKSIHLSACTTGSYITLRAVRAILDAHGHSLEKLSLVGSRSIGEDKFSTVSYLTENHIRDIGLACPNLRQLRFPVRREKGAMDEVKIYQALGRHIPQVRDLWLRLDCMMEWKDNEFQQAQDMMVNIAIDDGLARSIMETIVTSSPSSSLSCLRIETAREMHTPRSLSEILDKLDFRWKCLRLYDQARGRFRIVTQRL
ncbi:hypothetical protein BDV18DRAFT_159664 [Aspergillus unguis]